LIADFDNNPRAWASAWPINETARAAPVITPSVPLAKESTRKSSMNTRLKMKEIKSLRRLSYLASIPPAG
jgi:hypothetical protein